MDSPKSKRVDQQKDDQQQSQQLPPYSNEFGPSGDSLLEESETYYTPAKNSSDRNSVTSSSVTMDEYQSLASSDERLEEQDDNDTLKDFQVDLSSSENFPFSADTNGNSSNNNNDDEGDDDVVPSSPVPYDSSTPVVPSSAFPSSPRKKPRGLFQSTPHQPSQSNYQISDGNLDSPNDNTVVESGDKPKPDSLQDEGNGSTESEITEHGDDEEEEGVETDLEDNAENDDDVYGVVFTRSRRDSNPVLPTTVTKLDTLDGGKVYLVGTAHFSLESQDDVAKTIQATQPDIVMVELCKGRVNILQLDEKTILEEAKNMNLEKIRSAINQSGLVQGVMYLLLLSMSAHLTKQLGMAPGGEFRRAFKEAKRVPGCLIHLGDRPIQITLQRALAALSWWQKLRLAWYMITSKEPISKEEVERCKQRDLLEELLAEMTGEFPALSQVFVKERDIYLSHSLQLAVNSAAKNSGSSSGSAPAHPAVVVGVVGIGHVPGIVENWGKVSEDDIPELLKIPEPSLSGKVFRFTLRASVIGLFAYGCYRIIPFKRIGRLIPTSLPPVPNFSKITSVFPKAATATS